MMKGLLVFLLPVFVISDVYIDKPIPFVSAGYQVDQVDSGWTNNGVLDCLHYDPVADIRTYDKQTTYGHYADPCVVNDCTDAYTVFSFFSVSSLDDPTKYNSDFFNGVPDITLNPLPPLQCQVYYINDDIVLSHDRNVTCDPMSTIDLDDSNGYCVCRDGYIPSSSSISSCDPIPEDRTKEYCQSMQSQAIVDSQNAVFAKLPDDYNTTNSTLVYFSAISQDYQCSEDAALSYGVSIGKLDPDNSSIDAIAVSYVSCAHICQVAAFVTFFDSTSTTTDTTTTDTTTTDTTTTDTTTTGTTTGTTTDTTTDTTTIDTTTTDTTTDLAETNDILRDILDTGGESAAESSMSYLDNMSQFLDDLSQSSDNIEQSYNDLRDVLDGTYTTNFTTSSQCTITFTPFNSPIDVDMCKWSYIVRPWVVFITTLFLLYFLIRLHIYLFVHLIRR